MPRHQSPQVPTSTGARGQSACCGLPIRFPKEEVYPLSSAAARSKKNAAGFNQNEPPLRTVTMAIDLPKAFDIVIHTRLIKEISASGLHQNIILWLSAYLRGRNASCRYKDAMSTCHAVRAGVPQGSVISPLFFKVLDSNYPSNCQ